MSKCSQKTLGEVSCLADLGVITCDPACPWAMSGGKLSPPSCHLAFKERREESGVMETTHYCIGQLLFLRLNLIHTIAQAGLRLMAILLSIPGAGG